MADLEGFFAKKDKKKTKPKKFVPEEMAQKLEEAEQKQKEKERREELERERLREEQLAKDDPNHKKGPVDEWQDEEEVQVDLSDLNIKELPQEEEKVPGQTLDADGNPTTAQPAVWNRNKDKAARDSSPEPEPEPVKPPAPVAPAPEPAKPSGGGGYVPPHRRNLPPGAESSSSSSGASGGPLQPVRLGRAGGWHSKKAPDISSDEAFPTLGSAVEETARGAWGQRRAGGQDFQRVRHGNTSSQEARAQAPKLSLGNQFDALQSNAD